VLPIRGSPLLPLSFSRLIPSLRSLSGDFATFRLPNLKHAELSLNGEKHRNGSLLFPHLYTLASLSPILYAIARLREAVRRYSDIDHLSIARRGEIRKDFREEDIYDISGSERGHESARKSWPLFLLQLSPYTVLLI
jgi:hypothetical protein